MSTGKAHPLLRLLALAGIFAASLSSRAENSVLVYTGSSFTQNSDLHVAQRDAGTDITVHDVQWSARPLKAAPYYGLRLVHFLDRYPGWGIGLDYTHYKVYADTGRTVRAAGTWQGVPLDAAAPMDRYVQHFEISHGVNMIGAVAIYRWTGVGGMDLGGKLRPYVGAGLVHYRPHSENIVGNRSHETGYRSSGGGYELLGGAEYRLTDRTGVFAEAKFNRGTANVDVAGGSAETRLRTWHVAVGASFSF